MKDDDDPRIVTTADPEPRETAERPARATTRDLLAAIRDIPDQVAAKVGSGDSGQQAGTGGRAEVTFEPEPAPVADEADDEGAGDDEIPDPAPTSTPRAGFRHPSKPRRKVEIGA